MKRLLRREHYCAENVLEGSLISTDLVLGLVWCARAARLPLVVAEWEGLNPPV